MAGKWLGYINLRIVRNKNFLCVVTGPTGSGKSWATIRICEELDKEFNVNRIVFSAKQLMNLVNHGGLKKGSCILWDETQIDLSSRNWQSTMNKMLNYLVSTFRHRNFILFFTAPYLDFIDTSTLKMFHANFETDKIDRTNKRVVLKPKLLDYNQSRKKWFTPYLKFSKPGYGSIKIKRWAVSMPSKEILEAYEAKKIKFTSQLNLEIEDRLANLDGDGKPRKILTPHQANVLNCWKKGILIQKEIVKELNISQQFVSKIEKSIRNKGYLKENYQNSK
jgi:hypothetical protein